MIHPWNTICISQGWQAAGAEPTTRFLLSAAQEWIRCAYSRAIDSLILHASPPERVAGVGGGLLTLTTRQNTYIPWDISVVQTAVTADRLWSPPPSYKSCGCGWRSHFNRLIYILSSLLLSDIMKANTHDLLIGHIFSVYWAEGGHSRAGSPEEGGVCVISPVTRDRMTFGSHFKSIFLFFLKSMRN